MTNTDGCRTNELLAGWIERARVSYRVLADEVNATARQHGEVLATDASRISRWVTSGERPRGAVQRYLAETLTRLCRLPCPLTPADLGFQANCAAVSTHDWRPAAIIGAIAATTRSDAVTPESAPPTQPLLTGRTLMDTVQPWLHAPEHPLPEPAGYGRIGESDVRAIEQTTHHFRTWDNLHGGGLSRRAVVGQLQAVSERAHQARSTEAVGRQLMAALADLASVAGWMTHDIGRHAESQRYFLLGLQAARQAGPEGVGIAGHLLNCLARQANHLGHLDDALDLVQTAQYGTRKLPVGRLHVILSVLEARCHATLGNLYEAHRAIDATEETAGRADPGVPVPPWAAWCDDAERTVTIGVCHYIAAEHDPASTQRAVELISQGTALRPADRVRSQAFDQIVVARAHLRAGQLDAAATSTTTALDMLESVASTRLGDRLRELAEQWQSAPDSPETRQMRDRLTSLLHA